MINTMKFDVTWSSKYIGHILDREPGGSSLAGKVTLFQAHGRNAWVFPCMETQICRGFVDGCGQEGQNKGGPQLG